jgi:hypothetical protein
VPASASAEPVARGPNVTVMTLPDRVEPQELTAIDGAALGLLSGGIGNVPASQTYIDITQGARLNPSLYDGDVPSLRLEPSGEIAPDRWQRTVERAQDAPSDLVPGLLASTLAAGGVTARATSQAGNAAVIAADEAGRVTIGGCDGCPGLTVTAGEVEDAERLARSLRPGDLLIAFERPPAEDDRQLALAVAGAGTGVITSDSTRIDGLALATDLAPTILERLDVPIPDEMAGRVMGVAPVPTGPDAADQVQDTDDRLAAVSPRRGEAIGINLLVWAAITMLAGLALRGRGLRVALPLLALSVAFLPLVLLATAAIEPSEAGERLIAGAGAPLLALLTLRTLPGWGALAAACLITVAAYAIDVVAGSPLTSYSLLGPNPALGVRFFGIGNELEASLTALLLVGTGAALAAWSPDATPRRCAAAFAAAALLAVAAFAPGRFGADVGAAIGIPAGAAVAIAVTLEAGARRAILILAAVPAALAAIALLDLLLGGDAHLSRSVLEAGGLDEVGQVAERRLRLCADSFSRYSTSPVLWVTVALIAWAVVRRRTVLSWFDGAPAARAGFLGAAAATLIGTLANDSGAMLLMIGTAVTSLAAGYAWATQIRQSREVLVRPSPRRA